MNETVKPTLLVVPTYGSLEKLQQDCTSSGIFDAEVLLARAIDCLVHRDYVGEELKLLCESILDADESVCQASHSQRDDVSFSLRKEITASLSNLIENMTANVRKHNLHDKSFFHYEFARIGDDENIILQRVN